MIPLYGIAGPARVGKDTVGAFLKAGIVGGYTYAFADPMRRMLLAGFELNLRDQYWRDRKEQPAPAFGNRSPRYLMQTLGTEWGRKLVNPDIWVDLAAHQFASHGATMIVTDVRFENEAHWIRKAGGRVLHVSRPAADKISAHVSEDGIRPFPEDWKVVNDGTLEDLMLRLRQLLTP